MMAVMTDKRTSTILLQAQTGQLLSEFLAGGPPAGQRAGRGAVTASIDRAGGLDGGQRLQIIDALIIVIGGAYCHLVQKRAAYALDPVQALQLLRSRVARYPIANFTWRLPRSCRACATHIPGTQDRRPSRGR